MASVSYKEFYNFKREVLSRLEALELGPSPIVESAVKKIDIPTIDTVLLSDAEEDAWNGISPKTVTLLKSVGLDSPDEVLALSDEDILAVKGIGQKSLAEIREKLNA